MIWLYYYILIVLELFLYFATYQTEETYENLFITLVYSVVFPVGILAVMLEVIENSQIIEKLSRAFQKIPIIIGIIYKELFIKKRTFFWHKFNLR
jgi:hypothetical protein